MIIARGISLILSLVVQRHMLARSEFCNLIMPRLSNQNRAIAIGLLEANFAVKQIARRMGVSPNAIRKLRQKFQQYGDVNDRQRSGRPTVTTPRQNRFVANTARRSRTSTARAINDRLHAAAGAGARRCSDQTVRNRLHAAGLHARRMIKRPALSLRHKQARLEWARDHEGWTRQQWSNVMFSDETRATLHHIDGRSRVWRRPGEQYTVSCVQPTTAFGGGSVMVWAGISARRKTELIPINGNLNAVRYIAEVLEPHVLPYAAAIGDEFKFMDDNARPHRAIIVNDFLTNHGIERIPWPANSPDLNPIEHLWDQLKRAVYRRVTDDTVLGDLHQLLHEEWVAIPQQRITRLINSMRARCRNVIANNGGYTRY